MLGNIFSSELFWSIFVWRSSVFTSEPSSNLFIFYSTKAHAFVNNKICCAQRHQTNKLDVWLWYNEDSAFNHVTKLHFINYCKYLITFFFHRWLQNSSDMTFHVFIEKEFFSILPKHLIDTIFFYMHIFLLL